MATVKVVLLLPTKDNDGRAGANVKSPHKDHAPMRDDPAAVDKVLGVLRQYGWDAGYDKLAGDREASGDEGKTGVQDLLAGWLAAEQGNHDQAVTHFEALAQVPALAGWAKLALALVATRQKNFKAARQHLERADAHGGSDPSLRAAIDHERGRSLYYDGKIDEAQRLLCRALQGFGDVHFASGRVLDMLGMIYNGRDNFHAAQEFFTEALERKEQHHDDAGQAVTHGQLGRLYLEWGLWDKAEHHFQQDLQFAQSVGDEAGQAQMYNFLGQVAFTRRNELAATGQEADARQHLATAAGWLDMSLQLSQQQQQRWPVLEAYACNDRARVAVAQGDLAGAETLLGKAEDLFGQQQFSEGLAHVRRSRAVVQRVRERWDEALKSLQPALRYFTRARDAAEVAGTLLEIARVRRDARQPLPVVRQAYLDALQRAEACRRSRLVREIERDLKGVDADAYYLRLLRRCRGPAAGEDVTSLLGGVDVPASVLYLDLVGSSAYARGRAPAEVTLTLNQMMAEFAGVLRRHEARVSTFRGDGFLALLLGDNHPLRAVTTALELLQALGRFNEPRTVLKRDPFAARIGIATGPVFLGNVGTYEKMDFTAIGTTANLGARLEGAAEPGFPCICRNTHNTVGDRFHYKDANGRAIAARGIYSEQVWDVVGPAGP